MNAKRKVLVLVVALMLLVSACSQRASTPPAPTPVVPPVNTPTAMVVTGNSPTAIAQVPTATQQIASPTAFSSATPGTAATATSAPAVTTAGECSLTDGTAQLQLTKSGQEWTADPKALKVVASYNDTRPGHDVSKISGCDIWWEYEHPSEKKHVLVVGRDDASKAIAFLGSDGLIHIPTPKGGSLWVGPSEWNTGNMQTPKPSIALEMLAERRVNQIRNGYNWPMELHLPGEPAARIYGVDHKFGSFYSGCKDLTQPSAVNVAGTMLGEQFYASIGMEGCLIAVKLNGHWTYWRDARDNVMYSGDIQAWLFPVKTTEEEAKAWIAKQK